MEDKIVIQELSQFYGKKQALRDVTLTVEKGMFGLLGRNGAGKTTLMRTLSGLLPAARGNVAVCGVPVHETKEIRRMIGYLPQDFSMYPSMTAEGTLDYLGILSGVPKEVRRKRIPQLLERVNLTEQRGKKIKALSGGMKRRLGIAQALLHEPPVLIVDEPTAGLDPEERVRFRNLLCETAEERIVILSTHIVGDVEAACSEAAILDEGRLIWNGSVESLLRAAEGRVFSCTVPRKELPLLREHYIVTEISARGNESDVRLLAPEGTAVPAQARAVEPGAEDAYLYCLRTCGGER